MKNILFLCFSHRLFFLLLCLVCGQVSAQNASGLHGWQPNASVSALAEDATYLYLGGSFTSFIKPNVSGAFTRGTGVNTTDVGNIVSGYPVVDGGNVHVCISDGAGGWYIGGNFTQVGGVVRNRIARIKSDKSVDMTWNPNADDDVYSLALSGTDLYVGGDFFTIGGQSRNHIAKLSTTGTGTADATWNPNASSSVEAIVVSGTSLYAGGYFTTIGGQSRNRIAKLSTTGTGAADATWNPNADAGVEVLAISGTTLYVGGVFTNIGGQTRNHIAKLSTTGTGTADATWNPDVNVSGYVYAFALSGTSLYVGGWFEFIGGQVRNGVAKLSTTGTGAVDATWNPNVNNDVFSLALSGTDLYLGGRFTSVGGQGRNYIAKVSATGTGAVDATWNPNTNDIVYALALSGTTLYAGGSFTAIGGVICNRLVRIQKSNRELDLTWSPNPDGYVSTLALSGTDLYVGGSFSQIGGQTRFNIAKISTTGTGLANATWTTGASSVVSDIVLSGTTLYVAGSFTQIGGQTRNRIAKLSTTGAVDATWNPNINNQIFSLAVSGTDVYVGGLFTSVGGQTRNRIAKLSGTGTGAVDPTWNPNANSSVFAFAFSGTDVYVGGNFTTIGGQTRNYIAKLSTTGTGTADATWNPNANASTTAFIFSGTDMYVGGNFTTIGGQSRNRIAKLSTTGTGTVDAIWNPGADQPTYSFVLSSTDLYVGGAFTNVGGQSLRSLAVISLLPSTITLSTTTLSGFNSTPSTASTAQSFTISGTNLAINAILSTNTTDWELSTNNTTFFTSLNLTQSAGTLVGQPVTVYARLKAGLSAGTKNATLTASSTGTVSQTIALSGTVSKDNQTITFNALPTKNFGDASFALTASSNSGLAISYSSSNTSVATISGNTVTIVGIGTTNITASQAGNTNYNAATDVVQTLTVNKGNQTITFNALPTKNFGDASFALTASSNSGLAISYSSSNTSVATVANGIVTIVGAGTTDITASQAGNANYNAATDVVQTLTVNKGNQTITFNALPTKTFGDAPFALNASISSNLAMDYSSSNTSVATVANGIVTIVGTGTTDIVVSQAGNANYNAATDVVQTLTVNKATQTITFNALPTKTFGDAPFASNASTSSNLLVTYSSSNTSVATVANGIVTIVGAGTTTITASQNGNENYLPATSVSQELIINKANQAITFNTIADKVYGDSPFQLNATSNSNLAVSYSIITTPATGVATLSGNTVTIIGLGSVSITASQAGNTNYNPATEVVRTFQVLYPTNTQPSVAVGEVVAFPNPSKTGVFEVRGLQSIDKQQVRYLVINASGKQIASGIWVGKDIETLNLSAFAEGVYILDLRGGTKQITKKIVKQ